MKLFIKYWIYYLRKLNWWSVDDFGKIRVIVFWCEIIFGIFGLIWVGFIVGCFYILLWELGMLILNRLCYWKLRFIVFSLLIISIIYINIWFWDVFIFVFFLFVRKLFVMLFVVFCLVFVYDNMIRIFNYCISVVYLFN